MAKSVIVCRGIDHRPIAELFALHSMLHFVLTLKILRLLWAQRQAAAVLFPSPALSETRKRKRRYKHEYIPLRVSQGPGYCSGYCENVCFAYLELGGSDSAESLPLHILLNLTENLECQDRRDRIYGILSMVGWKYIPYIEPDYKIDTFDLALQAMKTILIQTPAIDRPRASRLADSLNRSMSLHMYHETPKHTTLEHHTVRKAKIEDLNSHCFVDYHWLSCEITKDHSNIWKLGIEFDSISHRDLKGYKHRCKVHKNETHCQRRFFFGNLEDKISNEYIQMKDREGNLMALLPQGTKSGDFLLGVWIARGMKIDSKFRRTKTPRYLILRKEEPGYYSIVGQAIVAGACVSRYDHSQPWFRVHYHPQDALNLIISWAQCEAYEKRDLSLMTWDMAKELLDLKVCNQPFSSYAIEQHGQFIEI